MALRVLLADESSTIKKVIQLALQDYAVDVRSVNVGIDVAPVAKQFQPDIIFADVLLQKVSGYEVASQLKADPALGKIPLVLMWSGFMELDEDKFQVSRADAQLEKPFDVNALRKLIENLVPKTKNQDLSQYLAFPSLPNMDVVPTAASAPPPPVPSGGGLETHSPDDGEKSTWSMDNFAPIESFSPQDESFQELSLPKTVADQPEPPQDHKLLSDTPEDDGKWVQRPINRFKSSVPPEMLDSDDGDLPVDYVVPEGPITPQPMRAQPQSPSEIAAVETEIELEVEDFSPPPLNGQGSPAVGANAHAASLTEEQLTRIIQAQSKEMIEAVIWKVVPDLARQLIEKELQRLLAEKDA